jgi:hypothetical protein
MKKHGIFLIFALFLMISVTPSVKGQSAKAQEIVNIAISQEGKGVYNYDAAGKTPWCALFVAWVYRQAGIPFTGVNAWANSFLTAVKNGQLGTITTDPQPGDLVVYGACNTGDDPSCNHIDIVIIKNPNGSIVTVGGNVNGTGSGVAHTQTSKVVRCINGGRPADKKVFIRPNSIAAPPAPVVIGNGNYTIRLASGKALDAEAPSIKANGCKVQIWGFSGATNQQWTVTAVGGGKYTLRLRGNPAKALDLNASNTANDGAITLWDYHGGPNQQWLLTSVGNGFFKIQSSLAPNRVVDVSNILVNTDGTKVHLWDFLNAVNQLWKIEPCR